MFKIRTLFITINNNFTCKSRKINLRCVYINKKQSLAGKLNDLNMDYLLIKSFHFYNAKWFQVFNPQPYRIFLRDILIQQNLIAGTNPMMWYFAIMIGFCQYRLINSSNMCADFCLLINFDKTVATLCGPSQCRCVIFPIDFFASSPTMNWNDPTVTLNCATHPYLLTSHL